MLFEIVSTALMGGLAVKAHLSKSGIGNDSRKLNKIFTLSGLNVKDGKETLTTQLVRKINHDWGVEYRYRIPWGRSYEDYLNKIKIIEAGINSRSFKLELKDIQSLKLDRNIIENIRSLYEKKLSHRKEIELSYDGLLKVKVYNEPMPEKMEWSKDLLTNSWAVPIGLNRSGVVCHDFDKRKHLIIAGATGFGKSVTMKGIITSLTLMKPDDVSFSLIDLKGGSAFTRFQNLKQTKYFGTNNEEALDILKEVQKEMNTIYEKVVNDGYEDAVEAGITKRHFLIIDEAADIAEDRACMDILTDIVRKGRGACVYVIYATQYPSKEAVPMQIKRNIPARLCFVLDSATASTTVLDGPGAESLPEIPGRGIYKKVKNITIQTPFISNKRIDELIQPFRREVANVKRKTRKDIVVFEKTGLS